MAAAERFDVNAWLAGLGLSGYAQAFRDNDVDAGVLRSLTMEDLREIGVVSVGHRRRILNAVAHLADEPAIPSHTATPVSLRETAFAAAAERRQITLMFCDLIDSTALS